MGLNKSKLKNGSFKLSEDDIKFLIENTKYSREEIISWYKKFKKGTPTGKLSKEKFLEVYRDFSKTDSDTFGEHVFRVFDMDGNGAIDFKELLVAIAITSTSNPEKKLEWAFKMYDVNNDGMIEKDEMKKIVKAFYEMIDAHRINQKAADQTNKVFERSDLNNDGKISFDEFLEACKNDSNLSNFGFVNN